MPSRSPSDAAVDDVIFFAVAIGGYSAFVGGIYRSIEISQEVGKTALLIAGYSYVACFTNVAFIFAFLVDNEAITKWILQMTLIVYAVCMAASFYTLTNFTITWGSTLLLWELPRLIGILWHLKLLIQTAKRLFGDPPPAAAESCPAKDLAHPTALKDLLDEPASSTTAGPAPFRCPPPPPPPPPVPVHRPRPTVKALPVPVEV